MRSVADGPRRRAVHVVAAALVLAGALQLSAPASAQPPQLARTAASVEAAQRGASAEVLRVLDWVVDSSDNQQLAFAILDKSNARLFVFDATARLRGSSPVLLGMAIGDDSVPGIGDREFSAIRPHERTTPAGRFISEPGRNLQGEDIVWVDYDAAVSMHRVRANVARERRLERLASPTPVDNRISFGCINIPAAFYEGQIKTSFGVDKGLVYVLPETRPLHEVFKGLPAIAGGSPAALSRTGGLKRTLPAS